MTMSSLVIEVEHLHKHFGSIHAVNDVSLQVKQGEVFGFLGPNGSGKTTMLRMLCGLLTPDSGTGTCFGYDIVKESLNIKAIVGYMTQRFSLYEDLSVAENLNFIAKLYQLSQPKVKVAQSLEALHLTERQNQLTGTLSGGWKQRVALAAALLHEPKLLLLDEPTAGVDPTARREFWQEVMQLSQQGITTLVSTHYMDEAVRCSRLAYLAKGKILVQGSPDTIIRDANLTVWEIIPKPNQNIAPVLTELPGVLQINYFGQTLHVSGEDTALLQQSLESIRPHCDVMMPIETSLEDVFIALMNNANAGAINESI